MTRTQGRASFRRRAREAVTVKHDKGSGPNGYRVDILGEVVGGNAWSYKAARARRAEVIETLVDFFVPREAPVAVERDETDDSL